MNFEGSVNVGDAGGVRAEAFFAICAKVTDSPVEVLVMIPSATEQLDGSIPHALAAAATNTSRACAPATRILRKLARMPKLPPVRYD